MTALRKHLNRSTEIVIDTDPKYGKHRRVKFLHDGRVEYSIRMTDFVRAIEAYREATGR